MKITIEQRKLLTKWLGECVKDYCEHDPDHGEVCPEVARGCCGILARTFDNWDDFEDTAKILKDKGYGDVATEFLAKAFNEYSEILQFKLIPERFCVLVAEAIKEGIIK